MGQGRVIVLLIVTPLGDQVHSVPGGVGYVDEMLREAGLSTEARPKTNDETWLPACLSELNRRFGHAVRVRLVNPMSLQGLYLSIRYRFRGYPAVIMPDGQVLVQPSIEELIRTLSNIV